MLVIRFSDTPGLGWMRRIGHELAAARAANIAGEIEIELTPRQAAELRNQYAVQLALSAGKTTVAQVPPVDGGTYEGCKVRVRRCKC